MSVDDVSLVTRLSFAGDHELTVTEPVDEVVMAVRRDHPNPVRLTAAGVPVYVNWEHVDFFAAVEP